ncbi:glutathione S-transferase family protein [Muricoccus radiodurans]|uniref:glutathione S-transferase family protein n=1 Tax=Muricoccus radiodurans TaxID=2231721 RepID=UPI003CEE0246
MSLKLYGVLRSRASRPVWLLKELGVPYERVPVLQASRVPDPAAPDAPLNTASAAFRAINPNGMIPTLVDDELVLHESLAITLHLARKHGGPLAPASAAEDSLMTMWTLWAATNAEPHTILIVYYGPTGSKGPDEDIAGPAMNALRQPFAVLEQALREGGGFLVGGRFTVADLNVAEVMRYAQPAKELFDAHPAVGTWINTCQSREAYKAMMAERSAEPL